MDFLRNGYQGTMRLWLEDNSTTVVRWFRVAPGSVAFTEPSYFRSPIWEPFDATIPVGEQKVSARSWDRGNNVLGYRGVDFCGSLSAIMNGGVHGVDTPIVTNPDGSSSCCNDASQVNANGVGVGTTATTVFGVIGYNGAGPAGVQSPAIQSQPNGMGNEGPSVQARLFLSSYAIGYGLDTFGQSWVGTYLPSLVSSYLTATTGVGVGTIYDQGGDVAIVGEVRMFAFNAAPAGWLECDGSNLSQSTYAALYALLGSTFGPAIGGNFVLPNMNRQVAMGRGGTSVQGPGNAIGNQGGVEEHYLTDLESALPSHSHGPDPAASLFLGVGAIGPNSNVGVGVNFYQFASTAAAQQGSSAQPHVNVQPSLVLKFMIFAGP